MIFTCMFAYCTEKKQVQYRSEVEIPLSPLTDPCEGRVLCKLNQKEREEWKINFEERVSTVLSEEKIAQELSACNYKDKFYYLLCFEEFERIEFLSNKLVHFNLVNISINHS